MCYRKHFIALMYKSIFCSRKKLCLWPKVCMCWKGMGITMEKRLKEWLNRMEKLNIEELSEEEHGKMTQELLIQIGFFQHERFVHLIVTITFALLTMMSVMSFLFLMQPGLLVLTILLLVLLVPYVRHYYILENGVQKLYEYYDMLVK